MTQRAPKLARMLAEEHAKVREAIQPYLKEPGPVVGVPSRAFDEFLEQHAAVVEAIAKRRKAGKKKRGEV